MSFTTLIFLGIPETIALTTMCFVLAKTELIWKRIVLLGCIMSIVTFLIRQLPVTFGLHTIVSMIMLILSINQLGKTSVGRAIIVTIMSFVALIIAETITSMAFFTVFRVSPEAVSQNSLLMIASGWPAVILLFLTSYLILMFRQRKIR